LAWLQVKSSLSAVEAGVGWQLAHVGCPAMRCRSMAVWLAPAFPWQDAHANGP